MTINIRKFSKNDIDAVCAIESAVHIAPWTREIFQGCFVAGYLGWVLELEGKIIGFGIISIYEDECHVLNLCVEIKHQRQGFGRKILEHAIEFARQQKVMIIYLEVRRSNTRAIALYQKLRFQQVGVRKDYYPVLNGREDALILAAVLDKGQMTGA